ncbi:MAG: PilC/PilY family type IV pilus protein, partial [Gemmatimonadales bacterium]
MAFSTLGTDGGTVLAGVGSDQVDVISAIEGIRGETWKPLGEALYEATRYFAQIVPAYNAADYTYTVTAQDPYYFVAPKWAGTAQYAPCCNSYAIVFTDGESTEDKNIPSGLQDVADAVHGSHCTGSGCSGHRDDYGLDGTHYLDDIAYWAHTTDLRQATIPVLAESGNDLSGDQSLTVYSFYAFGNANARELLHSTAKAGAFIDKDGDNFPDATGQTCTYPTGSPFGSGDSTSSVEWDTDQDCVADAYFESNDASTMRNRLIAAFTSILQRGFSGSAASVLASTSGEGALYQSFFFPSTIEGDNEITWTGHAQSLFLDAFGNLREDSNGDAKLVFDEDKIIRTRLDTVTDEIVVDRFDDSDGNGLADSSTPSSTVALTAVNAIWKGGERLALTASSARKIKTWIDQDNDGRVDGGEEIDFTTGNASALDPYLRADASGTYTATNIINFIRGDQVTGMRNRQLTVGGSLEVWKLGDVIHSQPVVVGAPAQRYDVLYGDSSYTAFFAKYYDRRHVVYVGANDGMLHGLNGGYYHAGDKSGTSDVEHGYFTRTPTDNSGGALLGDELFGFIPQELLPQLKWLTQTDYTHVYYVDMKPKVTEARIFTADTDHPNGWGTILIGGFRLGGSCGACVAGTGAPPMTVNADFSSPPDGDTTDGDDTRTFYSAYFVLDITNPESSSYPKLLWSFSSSDLGLTAGIPSMLRVSPAADSLTDDTNALWYLVMGSGPTGYDGSIAQSGKLFVIDLDAGPGSNNSNVITMTAETFNAFMGSPVTVDTNYDYRVDTAYMGSVIHDGTLPWRGKLHRLTMNDCTSPCSTATWGIDGGSGTRKPTEVLDTFPSSGSLDLGPVSAQPAVVIDNS